MVGNTGVHLIKHGLHKAKEWKIWINMRQRCTSPKAEPFKYYGGKGIYVCTDWEDSFLKFYQDMGVAPIGHQLDRIDSKKGYFKENCRWISRYRNSHDKVLPDKKNGLPRGISVIRLGRYTATIKINQRNYALGTFLSKGEAVEVYRAIYKEWHGFYPKEALKE